MKPTPPLNNLIIISGSDCVLVLNRIDCNCGGQRISSIDCTPVLNLERDSELFDCVLSVKVEVDSKLEIKIEGARDVKIDVEVELELVAEVKVNL